MEMHLHCRCLLRTIRSSALQQSIISPLDKVPLDLQSTAEQNSSVESLNGFWNREIA